MKKRFAKNHSNILNRSNLFSITIFSLLIFLICLHIFQSSLIVKSSFLIDKYEKEVKNLSDQNKNLEIVFSQKNSLRGFENRLEKTGFEKITKIDYIRVMEGSVAAK